MQFKLQKNNNSNCRYKYPKEECNESYLKLNQKSKPFEYVPARNDDRLNPYIKVVTEIWRANIDLQSITSIYAVINYIAKYASKHESRSQVFQDFLNNYPNDSNLTNKTLIAKILM